MSRVPPKKRIRKTGAMGEGFGKRLHSFLRAPKRFRKQAPAPARARNYDALPCAGVWASGTPVLRPVRPVGPPVTLQYPPDYEEEQ
jgi:hypothetical protein